MFKSPNTFLQLPIFFLLIVIYLFICCPDQTRTSQSRVRQDKVGLESGGHKAEASVSAVPMCASCQTPWPGSTTCQTHTGELARSGRESVTEPVDPRLKSTSIRRPTPPSGEQSFLQSSVCCRVRINTVKTSSFHFCYLVQHHSAAWLQVSAVPPLWISVQSKHTPPTVRPKLKSNPSRSAQFIPQVPLTALFTPLQESRAALIALFTMMGQTPQQTARFTQQGLTTAQTVLFRPQGTLRTAPCMPLEGKVVLAIMIAPCMGRGRSKNHLQTARFTPQGFKLASVLQNQKPRKRRLRLVITGTWQEETWAA